MLFRSIPSSSWIPCRSPRKDQIDQPLECCQHTIFILSHHATLQLMVKHLTLHPYGSMHPCICTSVQIKILDRRPKMGQPCWGRGSSDPAEGAGDSGRDEVHQSPGRGQAGPGLIACKDSGRTGIGPADSANLTEPTYISFCRLFMSVQLLSRPFLANRVIHMSVRILQPT